MKNSSAPNSANRAPLCGLCGTQQRHEDYSESSDHSSQPATAKDSGFVKHSNQYHPQHGYGFLPPWQRFAGAPPCYQHSPFTMTHCSQPTPSTSHGYPRYGPQWEGHDFHQGGYGGIQMFTPPHTPGQGPSSPGEPIVPPEPPENHPVNWPTCSISYPPPEHVSSACRTPQTSLRTRLFPLPAEQRTTGVTRIADLPSLPEMFYDNYISDDKRGDWYVSKMSISSEATRKPPRHSGSPHQCF